MHTAAHRIDCPSCRANARVSKWVNRLLNVVIVASLTIYGVTFVAERVASGCMKDKDACAVIAGVKK